MIRSLPLRFGSTQSQQRGLLSMAGISSSSSSCHSSACNANGLRIPAAPSSSAVCSLLYISRRAASTSSSVPRSSSPCHTQQQQQQEVQQWVRLGMKVCGSGNTNNNTSGQTASSHASPVVSGVAVINAVASLMMVIKTQSSSSPSFAEGDIRSSAVEEQKKAEMDAFLIGFSSEVARDPVAAMQRIVQDVRAIDGVRPDSLLCAVQFLSASVSAWQAAFDEGTTTTASSGTHTPDIVSNIVELELLLEALRAWLDAQSAHTLSGAFHHIRVISTRAAAADTPLAPPRRQYWARQARQLTTLAYPLMLDSSSSPQQRADVGDEFSATLRAVYGLAGSKDGSSSQPFGASRKVHYAATVMVPYALANVSQLWGVIAEKIRGGNDATQQQQRASSSNRTSSSSRTVGPKGNSNKNNKNNKTGQAPPAQEKSKPAEYTNMITILICVMLVFGAATRHK